MFTSMHSYILINTLLYAHALLNSRKYTFIRPYTLPNIQKHLVIHTHMIAILPSVNTGV